MDALKAVFDAKKKEACPFTQRISPYFLTIIQGQPALVTFVTAGYPRKEDTVDILLSLERGGSDIIELGVPFSDPIADGPVIQESNTVSRDLCSIQQQGDSIKHLRRSPSLTT